MVSLGQSTAQSLSIGGVAGRYDGDGDDKDGLDVFIAELTAATMQPASREAHSAVWEEFWSSSDLTVTAAAKPDNPATAAQADRVTLLDKVNRAAFHSMAMGKISAIKFNSYGIFAAYPSPKEDWRVWGPCQWFRESTSPQPALHLRALLRLPPSVLCPLQYQVPEADTAPILAHREHPTAVLSHARRWPLRRDEESVWVLPAHL